MTDFAVTGKKRGGKTLYCVALIREALKQGRRVATNLDIFPEKMLPATCKASLIRLPDRPNVHDFEAIGKGQEGYADDDNGLLILDETSTFFGARQFQDKSRQPMLDWLVHSGKYGWDVYYIMQGLSQVDKQIRETQIEYHVAVKNTNKWPIPFITPLFALFGITVRFPKMHIGIIKQGTELHALTVGRRFFKTLDLYPAYDTKQVLLDRDHPAAVGLHSVLSPWHVKGRYLGWWAMNKQILYTGIVLGVVIGSALGGTLGYRLGAPQPDKVAEIKLDDTLKPVGLISTDTAISIILPDGKQLPVSGRKQEFNVDYYLVSGKWVKM
jgi:hypothetical protein